MRRMSIEEARTAGMLSDDAPMRASDEATVLEVHGGKVLVLAPAGTGDEAAVAQAILIQGSIHLENERVLTFEVRAGAIGAAYRDAPLTLQEQGEGGATPATTGAAVERPPAGQSKAATSRAATAADIMTREVLTTGPEVSVRDLAKRLAYHRISGMPVVDRQEAVVGVVSEADLISKRGTVVSDIMATHVISVAENTPALEVAALLTRERIKRVPVLRDGRLVGLIGRSNVVSWVASQGGGASEA